MSDKEKIEFLLDFLKTEKFDNMDLTRAHALVSSYKWIIDQYQKVKTEEK